MHPSPRWPAHVILIIGAALRIALALVTPPERAYDDHYEPVRIVLTEGRVPSAADCWECYQPPAYYVLSAGLTWTAQHALGGLMATIGNPEHAARRILQFVSVAAGCATLWVCRSILRHVCKALTPAAATSSRAASWHEALALALIAFLPCHIYMSAMATNDALTYLVASLAILVALRGHASGWTTRGCVVTGVLAGATVLCKGYGWMTLAAIALSVWLFTRRPTAAILSRWRREIARPLALVTCSALAVAIWPAVRDAWIYDKPFVDNFDLFPETPMRYQPPESVSQTSFFSFRFPDLLRHPWLHTAHADSLWTQLYARLWFDYEGFNTTLSLSPAWQRLWQRCEQAHPLWSRARWDMLLSYAPDEVPADFRRVAVTSYLAGLPLTFGVVTGLILALRRSRTHFALLVLTAHFILAAAVPVLHELRLPHFAAMKTAFALSGLATAPVLIGLLLATLRGRVLRIAVVSALWTCTAAVAVADIAFVCLYYRDTSPT